MPETEFLTARSLSEATRLYGHLTTGVQAVMDTLAPAAAAAPDVLVLAGLDARFVSMTAALPRNPTAGELAALPADKPLSGIHRPGGAWQRVVWDRPGAQWVTSGAPAVTAAQVTAATAGLQEAVDEMGTQVGDANARTAALAQTFAVPDTANLTDLAPGVAQTLIVQHPERGGVFVRDADQDSPAVPTRRYEVGGVWFQRSSPRREWRADHLDVAGDFGGDWGAALNSLMPHMADGDLLIIPPGLYQAATSVVVPVPITFEAPGAEVSVSHAGIALDLKPGLGRLYAGEDATRSTYRGTLPALRGAGDYYNEGHIGVRVANAYWPDLALQRVEEFGIGVQVYADAAAAAGRDVGTTYGKFKLERLLNLVNVDFKIAPNPAGQPGRNYTTQNQFYGGSFTGSGVTHVRVRGSTIPGLIDNTVFIGTSFEGNPRYVFDFDGHADGFKAVGGCRLETGDGLEAVVKFGPNTYSCDIELDGFATPSRILLVQDQGKWNRVRDNKWPFGYVEYYDGVYYMDRPGAGAPAPTNWVPRSLDTQPWEETVVAQGQTKILDFNYRRRWQVTYTGSSLAANQIQFTGAPDASMDFEIDLDLIQSGSGVTSIDPAWFAGFGMGADAPAPNRLYKRDRYRLRRMNGLWAIIGHTAT